MADNVVRQDVVQIGFDGNELISSLQAITEQISKVQKSFETAGKSDPFEKTKVTAGKVTEAVKKTGESFEKTADEAKNAGNSGVGCFNKMKTVISKAAAAMTPLVNELNKVSSAVLKIAKNAADVGFGGLKKMASVSFNTLIKGIKAAAVGISTVGAAAAASVTAAVKSYADYEQLTGGVETLFGAGGRTIQEYAAAEGKSVSAVQAEYNSLISAQETMLKNADEAFKTTGLSANEYIETVTGFSAAMISSLGGDTQKAAVAANQALIDMSDNANKMGTDIESIQNAYQGFAKQNYTMLDNLKIGYGGTKTEMERLLQDAQKISGIKYDISSFSDITEAIHVIQTEMDITGTTSDEASSTISGSFGMMKASYKNLLTSLITGGDKFDSCIENLIDSVFTFRDNVMPAIKGAVEGLVKGLQAAAPRLANVFKDVFLKALAVLPSAAKKAGSIAASFLTKIKDLIIENKDIIISAASSIASTLISALPKAINSLASMLKDVLSTIWNGLSANKDIIIEKAVLLGANIIKAISEGITGEAMPTEKFDRLKQTIDSILTAVSNVGSFIIKHWKGIATIIGTITTAALAWKGAIVLVNTALKIHQGLLMAQKAAAVIYSAGQAIMNSAVWASVPALAAQAAALLANPITWIVLAIIAAIAALIAIVVLLVKRWNEVKTAALGVWENIKKAWSKAAEWINTNIVTPIAQVFSALKAKIAAAIQTMVSKIKAIFQTVVNFVSTNIITPIVNLWNGIINTVAVIIQTVVATIQTIWQTIAEWVSSNIITPIVNLWDLLKEMIGNAVNAVKSTIENIWGAISDWVNTNIITPVQNFFEKLWDKITSGVSAVKDSITKAFTSAKDTVTGTWNGVVEFFEKVWDTVKGIFDKVVSAGKAVMGVQDDATGQTKHAMGGLMTTRHIGVVAEAGPEMIIPLSGSKRKRALNLWAQTGNILDVGFGGYTPQNSPVSNINTSVANDNYNFNLNINVEGGGSDRAAARNIKNAVKDGIKEMMNSFANSNKNVREF